MIGPPFRRDRSALPSLALTARNRSSTGRSCSSAKMAWRCVSGAHTSRHRGNATHAETALPATIRSPSSEADLTGGQGGIDGCNDQFNRRSLQPEGSSKGEGTGERTDQRSRSGSANRRPNTRSRTRPEHRADGCAVSAEAKRRKLVIIRSGSEPPSFPATAPPGSRLLRQPRRRVRPVIPRLHSTGGWFRHQAPTTRASDAREPSRVRKSDSFRAPASRCRPASPPARSHTSR
jgi:hypothetical protein